MKKKLTIEEIEKSVSKEEPVLDNTSVVKDKTDKTPLKFSKKAKKKRKIRRYIILGVLAVFFAVIGFFGWSLYNSLSKVFAGGEGPNLLGVFNNQQLKGESSGRVNILVLGIGDPGHDGQNLSDTMMVISYDTKSKQASMISIPRDLYVKIGEYGSAKINAAHSYGETYKYPGGGPALAEKVVSQVLNIPIHYYVRADFTGLKQIVDAVGGVDINVAQDLVDPYYPADDGLGGKTLYIKAGMQHMNGTAALRYSRSRETTSDFDRARRQQQVLVAVKTKATSMDTLLNPQKISALASSFGTNLKTDLSVNELPRAIEIFKQIDTSKVKNKVFDNSVQGLLEDDSSSTAGYILIPRAGMFNYRDLQNAALNIFSDNSVATENAAISVQNGTTKTGLATKVADTLRNSKYNIIDVSSADSSAYSQTKIIDYSNGGKPGTISALEKLLGVKSTQMKGTNSYGADIVIIIGSDYQS